jgi:outer membrane immunogenic protein
MKKLIIASLACVALTAGPASAADLPLKAPVYKAPPMMAPLVTWTGCYFGGTAGGAWADTNSSDARFGTNFGSENDSGFTGGGQLGCDYQYGAFVFGVRGEYDWTQLNNGKHTIPAFPTLTEQNDFKWTATATGRIGYLVAPQALIYVQGGVAWTRNNITVLQIPNFPSETANDMRTGWTVGGGGEYMIMPNVSLFAEGDYMGFGTKTVGFMTTPPAVGTPNTLSIKQDMYQVLGGINIRFNAFVGPVVAKY